MPAAMLPACRLSKKWLAPLFRGFHSSLAPTARPGSYARKPLLRKAFYGFDAHVAKSDQSLRGLRPPNPRGFFDRLMPAAMLPACLCSLSFLLVCPLCDLSLCGSWAQKAPGCFTAQGLFSMRRFQAFVPLSAQPRLWVRPLPAPGFFCATARTPKCSWVRSGRR